MVGVTGATGKVLSDSLWSFLSAAVSSVGNFALSLIVLRISAPQDYAVYAFSFAGFSLFLNLNRAVTGSILLTFYSNVSSADRTEAVARSVVVSGLIGIIGLLTVGVAGVSAFGANLVCIAMACAIVGNLIVDTLRYSHFASQDTRSAACLDIMWTMIALSAMATLATIGMLSAWGLISMWALGAVVTAIYGLKSYTPALAWPQIRLALREHWPNRIPLALEMGALGLTDLVALWSVGIALGTVAVGEYRGSSLLLAPYSLSASAAFVVAVPKCTAAIRSNYARTATRPLIVLGLTLVAFALALSLVLTSIPDSVAQLVFGSQWTVIKSSIGAWCIVMIGSSVSGVGYCGLRAYAWLRTATVVRLANLIIVAMAVYVGGRTFGTFQGAVIGYGCAAVAVGLLGLTALTVLVKSNNVHLPAKG